MSTELGDEEGSASSQQPRPSSSTANNPQDSENELYVLNGAFKVMYNGNNKKAVCKLCDQGFKYHHCTSSLSYHLKAKHPFTGAIPNEKKQNESKQKTLSSLWSTQRLSPSHENYITNAIAKWIARDSRPYHVVEDKGLQYLLKTATKSVEYKLPLRKTISQRVHDLSIAEKSKVAEKLNSSAYIAITADCWSSKCNDSYLVLTAHTLSDLWEMETMTLGVTHTTVTHTAVNIKEQVDKQLAAWTIEKQKISSISTDNAYNMVNATNELGLNRTPCMAHTLQLSIQSA